MAKKSRQLWLGEENHCQMSHKTQDKQSRNCKTILNFTFPTTQHNQHTEKYTAIEKQAL